MKTSKNKKIIITSLVGLCLVALAGTYFLTRQPENEFIPAAVEESEPTKSWEEKTEPDTVGSLEDAAEDIQISGTPEDDTQVIVSENETGTIVNLTTDETNEGVSAEKPSEKPVTTEDTTNPETPPTYDESVPQAKPEEAPAPAPSADLTKDSGSHEGEIYDPVFGWIPKSGPTQHDVIDSDGDINKQVGTMGGS